MMPKQKTVLVKIGRHTFYNIEAVQKKIEKYRKELKGLEKERKKTHELYVKRSTPSCLCFSYYTFHEDMESYRIEKLDYKINQKKSLLKESESSLAVKYDARYQRISP